jgi:serine/threonine protein kinase
MYTSYSSEYSKNAIKIDCLEYLKTKSILPDTVDSIILSNKEKKHLTDINLLTVDAISSQCINTLLTINKRDYIIDYLTIDNYKEESETTVYHFRKVLGSGGFGSVYLAEDDFKNKYAIKVYNSNHEYAIDQEDSCLNMVQKWCGEFTPCLYEIYDFNDSQRLVMEFVDGIVLGEVIGTEPLEKRRGIDITKQMTGFLKQIHSSGIVHQDIKPDNIIMDPNNKIKFIDWGMCCTKSHIKKKLYCGAYGNGLTIPPELKDVSSYAQPSVNLALQNFDQMRAHDIWSVGVILLNWYGEKAGYGDEINIDSIDEFTSEQNIGDKKTAKIIKNMLTFDMDERLILNKI